MAHDGVDVSGGSRVRPTPSGATHEVEGGDETTRRARLAVLAHFLVNGASLGVWASRLPAIKAEIGMTDSQIAAATFVGAVVAMLSLRAAGPLVERVGSRRTLQVAGALVVTAPGLTASATGYGLFVVATGVSFMAASFHDVGMNSQGVAVERRLGRPVMSSFHAAFSIGSITGAAVGAATAGADVSYRTTFVMVAAALLALVLVANRSVLAAPVGPREEGSTREPLPQRPLLLTLGVLALMCFVAEGAAMDWTAIYLQDHTGAAAAVAALGFLVFNACMTAGRLAGDRLAVRFGALPLVRTGTAIGGVGLAVGLVLGTTPAGLVGFAVLGAGLSVVVPQLFSTAGAVAGERAPSALALISSIAYVGFLAGPAVIGAVAHWQGLRVALLVPAVLVLTGSLVASRLHVRSTRVA